MRHLGPTQKPVALSVFIFQEAGLRPEDLVFVPYLGSGPDLPAAIQMGLRVVACDVSRACCATAVRRLRADPEPEELPEAGPQLLLLGRT